jgi:hypothetical protein
MRCWVCLAAAFLLSSSGFASVVFTANFEQGALVTSDTNWSINVNGAVVADPLNPGNHVLEFTRTSGGGDLFSITLPEAAQNYLSFDYMYSIGSLGGGFIGVDDPGETWLGGDCNGCFRTYSNALDTVANGLAANQWNHIQIQFPNFGGGGTLQLKLEQFVGSAPNAYFDNITLSDSGFVSEVPEPQPALMLLGGVGALVLARKRRV